MIFLYLLLLLLILSLELWQYERVAIKRACTLIRVKRLCKKKSIKFKLINPFFAFSKNSRDEFDFMLKIGKTVIISKFYSALDTHSIAMIEPTGKICVKRKVREPLLREEKRKYRIVQEISSLPSMKAKKDMISKRYTCFPVILNEPEFSSLVIKEPSGELKEVFDSNILVGGCRWLDANTFISLIEVYSEDNGEPAQNNKNRQKD